jgi:hypothetical protein
MKEVITRQGDQLAETLRRNSELDGRVEQLTKKNQLFRESTEGLNGQLDRVEAVKQSAVGRVEEVTAAGGSEVKEDLSNVQGELTKMKEEIRRLKTITARQFFPPSMKEGRLRFGGGKETDTICDIPDGIIVHLTKECGGNVHDAKVVDVTCGSFEMETVKGESTLGGI